MARHNLDSYQPEPTPQQSASRLLPYSYEQIRNFFPVAEPDHEIILHTRSMSHVIRNSVTRLGELPYESADIDYPQINPENIAAAIEPTANYILEPNLLRLIYLDIELRSRGIDMFDLQEVINIKPNPGDNHSLIPDEGLSIGPPVIESKSDGTFNVVDGTHRLFLAMLYNRPIRAAIVSKFNESIGNPYIPHSWSDVEVVANAPTEGRKHDILPDHSEDDLVQMSLAGDRGSRVLGLPKEAPYFHEDPTSGPHALSRQINAKLRALRIVGLFPSAINADDAGGHSRVKDIPQGIPVDDNHFLASFTVQWLNENKTAFLESPFNVITETLERSKKSANLVIITRRGAEIDQTLFPAEGELSLPAEMRQVLNSQLQSMDLAPVAATDHPDLNPAAPVATGFHWELANKKYFSVLVVDYIDHGQSHSTGYLFNRRVSVNGESRESSILVPRTADGKIIFTRRHRELFGLEFLELPRFFAVGDYVERFKNETGIDLNTISHQEKVIQVAAEARDFTVANDEIVSMEITSTRQESDLIGTEKIEGSMEKSMSVVELTDREVHDLIAAGKLHCELSAAAVTIEQINSGRLIINPDMDLSQFSLYMEEYYNAVEAKYYLRPAKVVSGSGMRVGDNEFPNTGNSLIWEHTEVANDSLSLPGNLRTRSVLLSDVIDLIKSGHLDTAAIAHLSQVLRYENVWVLAQ